MTELEKLINQNPSGKSKSVIESYNFIKSIEEFQKEEIATLIVSDNLFSASCLVITNYRLIELENITSIKLKNQAILKDIQNVQYKESGFFSVEKLIITLTNTHEIEIKDFGQKQLKAFERALILCQGILINSPEENWKFQSPNENDNHSVKSEDKPDAMDDIITKKLTKLKNLFDGGLITKEDYEKRKSDLLDLL